MSEQGPVTRAEKAEAEVKRLRAALEVYALSENWCEVDERACGCTFHSFQHPDADGMFNGGVIARNALR